MKLLLILLLMTYVNAYKKAGSFEEINNGFKNQDCYFCHIPITEPDEINKDEFYLGNYLMITSKTCLSCHDGVTAPDVTSRKNNQTKHHPVSVEYDSNRAYLRETYKEPGGSGTWYLDRGSKSINSLLKNGKIVCSSCHNPHLVRSKFLRIKEGDTISSLCFGCHDI